MPSNPPDGCCEPSPGVSPRGSQREDLPYTILARAHETGPFDASALRSFEVKPTWLSQNGRAVIGATSLAGVIGLAAVAWKKGYLQRKKGDEFSFSF